MGNICKGKGEQAALSTEKFSDKYKLSTKVLGEGAYGKVMLGETVHGQEKVAVKLMDKMQMKQSDAGKMHKEVNILKALNHPNVVRVFDFYDDDDYFKIVMEYVDGGELFEKLVKDDDQYTEKESRDVIHTLIRALKHCKDRGVVHRDIKPENILLTQDGNIKLADFNLSKQIDPEMTDFKLLQTMCGTPNYVAPEVLSGRPYDYKCDVWSLGVIAFLLLSGGYLPFFVNTDSGEAKDELLEKVKAGRWSFSPRKAWDNVSDEAKDLLTHMLVKRTSQRFNYNQLLAHPWFKQKAEIQEANIIHGGRLLTLNSKRKLLSAAKVKLAVEKFKEHGRLEELMNGSDKSLGKIEDVKEEVENSNMFEDEGVM